jgi:redox-sensitive bicupin YhaK (pirin superfamily)
MITIRKSNERGHAERGWLESYHSFSFADYYDPEHMGFRSLRVINEDWIRGGVGFPTHPHKDMEIITYVLEGSLAHKDSMGNGSAIGPGDVQRMSAGTGVTHSEFNASETETAHLLQIWILPERAGVPPSYEEKVFPEDEKRNRLCLIASGDAREGSVRLNQDADVYVSLLDAGQTVTHSLAEGRGAWIQVAGGSISVNGEALQAGDAAAIEQESRISLSGVENAEVLLFDLS